MFLGEGKFNSLRFSSEDSITFDGNGNLRLISDGTNKYWHIDSPNQMMFKVDGTGVYIKGELKHL